MPRIVAALGVFATLAFCIGFNTARYPVVWNMVAPSAVGAQADESPQPARPEPPAAAAEGAAAVQPARLSKPAAAVKSPTASDPSPAAPTLADIKSQPDASATVSSAPLAVKPVCDPASGVCQIPTKPPEKPPEKAAKKAVADQATSIGRPAGSAPVKKPATDTASTPKKPALADKPVAEAATGPKESARAEKAAPAVASSPRELARPEKASPAAKPPAGPKKEPDQIGMIDGGKGLVPVIRPKNAPQTVEPSQGLVVRLPPVDETNAGPAVGESPLPSDGRIPVYPTTGVQ